MNFLNKLEYKYGKYAIKNLYIFIVAIYIVGLMIDLYRPSLYYVYLSLNIERLLHGEIWRIFTFIFYPPYSGYIFLALLSIYVYYSLCKSLCYIWSDFKFNVFILLGVLGHVLGGIVTYFLFGQNVILYPVYLAFSIFIAFAITFPETIFLVLFIFPVKAKYLAIFEIIIYIITIVFLPLDEKVCSILSLLNVIVFLWLMYGKNLKNTMKNLFRK